MQVRIWGELNCSYGGKNPDNKEGQTVQHAAVQMHPHAWGILKWNLGFVFVWLRTVETTRLVTSFTSSYLNVPLPGHLCNAKTPNALNNLAGRLSPPILWSNSVLKRSSHHQVWSLALEMESGKGLAKPKVCEMSWMHCIVPPICYRWIW